MLKQYPLVTTRGSQPLCSEKSFTYRIW